MWRSPWLALLTAWVLLMTSLPWTRADDKEPPPQEEEPALPEINPYIAPASYSVADLVRYIEKLQAKPKSIRSRAGFIEGIVDAAERVLKGQPNAEQKTTAALALFDTLHGQAMLGDEKLNTRLMEWSEQLASAGEEKIAKAASFHLFEKKVLAVTSGNPSGEERTKLLGELKQFFNKETPLTTKHLRLASETISLINGLEDKKAADTWFSEFGGLFAKSEDRDLARYGRQLLKKPGQPGGQASALVGKPLELEGTTVDGQPFDWASYRGKVVLVDFWATWCGPCVRELPNVKAAYEQYHARGFDVVAISLDNDIEALREFIQREQIPWVNIFDELEKGWDNPLAKKYGVRAIPMTILVGKDGNVITTNLRGEALAAELEKLLGDSQPSQPKQ